MMASVLLRIFGHLMIWGSLVMIVIIWSRAESGALSAQQAWEAASMLVSALIGGLLLAAFAELVIWTRRAAIAAERMVELHEAAAPGSASNPEPPAAKKKLFLLTGVRPNGKPAAFEIEADNPTEARREAEGRGLVIEKIQLLKSTT